MKKYLVCLLFPFLLNSLYAQEKKEPKKHTFVAEETFSLTENTTQNLLKLKYNYKTPLLEQLLEGSFDYNKTDEVIKRKLFRIHDKLDYKVNKYYGFLDTDYQNDKVNNQILYFTSGLGRHIGFFKVDLGYGYKFVDRTTFLNVLSSSISAEKNINSKWKLSGGISVKQPLKERPRKAALYFESTAKYKIIEHLNIAINYTKMRERPKNPNDSWGKEALRFGLSYEN